MKSVRRRAWVAAAAGALLTAPAEAQWAEQSFDLQLGWNSVFLEVDPAPAEADLLFQGQPFAAVWMRAPDPLVEGPPDCADPNDPSCTPELDTGWRVWVPPGAPGRVAHSLRLIRGGRVYLIEAREPTTWSVTGKPNATRTQWRKGFNLAGFHVVDDPNLAPTFASYLAASPAHAATVLYDVLADGTLSQVTDPANTRITPGRSVWVKSSADVEYDGPLAIDNGSLRRIDFGKTLLEHRLTLENLANEPVDVTLTYSSSDPVPGKPVGLPAIAGDVPMSWLQYGSGSEDVFQWNDLSTESWSLDQTGEPGVRRTLRLGVDRAGLPGAVLDSEGHGSQYQGLLTVTDGRGFLRRLPVTAQVPPGVAGTVAGGEGTTARPGLYIGHVTVDQVAWITAGARVWTGGSANSPQFAGTMHCFGGDNEGQGCFPGGMRCRGTPEIEQMGVVCEKDADCELYWCVGGFRNGYSCDVSNGHADCQNGVDDGTCGLSVPWSGTCQTATDCPGGTCHPFCVAAANIPCSSASDCPSGPCSADADTSSLRPAPAAFIFPIIVHLSSDGGYKMLTEVTMMMQPDGGALETPGQYVLVTPECPSEIYAQLEPTGMQDGQPFAVRVATAAFSFDGELPLLGGFETILAGETTVGSDHPLNPFRHRYHPDHDGLNSFGNPVEGEVYEITRSFLLTFADPPPELDRPGWGDSSLGGVYTETLEGLHKDAITVGGSFELHRVSTIPTLNAQ